MTPALSTDALIRQLNLSPHPEGGHYRETYRASTAILRQLNAQCPQWMALCQGR